jgi:hypothetical protein
MQKFGMQKFGMQEFGMQEFGMQKLPGPHTIALRSSLPEKRAAVIVARCLLAGLLTVSSSLTTHAAGCLSAPNAESGPGTHWRYRINHATNQRCWYLKRSGQAARPRPSSESLATPRTPRSSAPDQAPPAEPSTEKLSIRAWFSSTFAAFTGLGRPATNTETNEAPADDSSATGKQLNNEQREQKRSQQSKTEQQAKAGRSKPEKERSDTTRSPNPAKPLQVSILEAAGDKDIPGSTAELNDDERRTAIEAVGEKDVFAPPAEREQDWQKELENWQKELYEQFLMWRIKLLMSM